VERIGTLETICRYPVKSMAGQEVDEAFVGFSGLMGDRAYAFEMEQGPKGFPWLTGREQADLIVYRPKYVEEAATRLPADVEKSLHMAPGLFTAYPEAKAFALRVTSPDGQTHAVDSDELRSELEKKSGQKVKLRFSDRSHWDCRPVSLLGNASVGALGEELGIKMDRRRFRANFYVNWDDSKPYREDDLVGRRLKIGERLRIAVLERDPRCKMITLDPETGQIDEKVLDHVAKAHSGRTGVYAAVLVEGIVRKGDAILME
jgi:MOSC domain-containing protein